MRMHRERPCIRGATAAPRTAYRLIAALADPAGTPLARTAVTAALSLLRSGDRFTMRVNVLPARAERSRLAIHVEWQAQPGAPRPAIRRALGDALRIASPSYIFAPMNGAMQRCNLPLAWLISPYRAQRPHHPIGFVGAHGSIESAPATPLERMRSVAIHVPRGEQGEGRPEHLDRVVAAMLAMGVTACLEFTWTALDLGAAPGAEIVDLAEAVVLDVDAGEAWAHDPRGYALSLCVLADRVVPESLLRDLGVLMFGRTALTVERPDISSVARAAAIRHRDYVGPTILPTPGLLIASGTTPAFPASPARLPTAGICLGHTLDAGVRRAVRLPPGERTRHAFIIGATGTGKSTLMLRMLLDDIVRGDGVMLVDPHGDLFRTVLARVPAARAQDVVVLDAADREHPFAFNVLAMEGMEPRQAATLVTNELLAMFEALYDMRECGGPIFESYFSHAIRLLMTAAETTPTLADLARLFEERAFRSQLLERCLDEETSRFWKNTALAVTGDHALPNMTNYIVSKVNRFTMDAALRPIITHPGSALDLGRMMDERRIVLVHLGKGAIGAQSARFLGMALMMRLMAATLGRAKTPEAKRCPFNVYVDEFQTLATDNAATLLAEARKFGIGLTLASQTLGQVERAAGGLAEAVTGNVGSLIMTRLGPVDAHRLAAYAAPTLSPAELQTLPSFRALGSFRARHVPVAPFVFGITPPRPVRGTLAEADALV